jgi:uncharacterized sulfatase
MSLPDQPDLAIRDGNWKLLCSYQGENPQLYDLVKDRGETTNLATNHPEIVEKLVKAVTAWHQSMPPDNGPQLAREPMPPKGMRKKKKAP